MGKNIHDLNLYELLDSLGVYEPEMQLPMFKVEKFLNDFHISEDEESTLTGNKRDWITFLVLCVDRYYKPL